jgi:hypothetical protein
MKCVKENVPNFDTIDLLKGENGLEEIIIYKVISESHIGNLELTCFNIVLMIQFFTLLVPMTCGHVVCMTIFLFKWCI